MREFPFPDMRGGQEKIRIFLDVFRYVNDARRADKFFRGDAVHGRVRQILTANPVNGSIEMRSSVLAGFEGVPIPEGTAVVVAGEFAEREGRRVVPLRREREQGRGGAQRQSEIHDTQAASVEFFDQPEKDFRHDDPQDRATKIMQRMEKK